MVLFVLYDCTTDIPIGKKLFAVNLSGNILPRSIHNIADLIDKISGNDHFVGHTESFLSKFAEQRLANL